MRWGAGAPAVPISHDAEGQHGRMPFDIATMRPSRGRMLANIATMRSGSLGVGSSAPTRQGGGRTDHHAWCAPAGREVGGAPTPSDGATRRPAPLVVPGARGERQLCMVPFAAWPAPSELSPPAGPHDLRPWAQRIQTPPAHARLTTPSGTTCCARLPDPIVTMSTSIDPRSRCSGEARPDPVGPIAP